MPRLLLGPDVEPRRTNYDIAKTAELIRATPYPDAEGYAGNLLNPPSETEILELFGKFELK